MEHVLFSLIVNALGLLAVCLLKRAPPRLVLWVGLSAMSAVLVPWLLIGRLLGTHWLPAEGLSPGVTAALGSVEILPATIVTDGSLRWVLVVWLGVALLWLAITFLRDVAARRSMLARARPDETLHALACREFEPVLARSRVRRVEGSRAALTSGWRRPEIWIGERIVMPHLQKIALNHELAHVQAGDQHVVLLITVLERLLWWNPLIWLLGARARHLLEFDCDRRSAAALGVQAYRSGLASLLLQTNRGSPVSLALNNRSRTRGVITRMNRIDEIRRIHPGHVLLLLALFATCLAAGAVFAGEREETRLTIIDCNEQIPHGARWRMSIDQDTEKGELSVTLLDNAQPESRALPAGAGPYVRCLSEVLGIPDMVQAID